jgi:mycofactocin precursor
MGTSTLLTDHTSQDERTEPTVATSTDTPLLDDESLIEEVSIDGMCGVY